MAIRVDIDVMLARRKMAVGELASRIGITPANLAVLKNGRAKAVRFTTLQSLCEVLDCQPGDLLVYEPDDTQSDAVAETGPSGELAETTAAANHRIPPAAHRGCPRP